MKIDVIRKQPTPPPLPPVEGVVLTLTAGEAEQLKDLVGKSSWTSFSSELYNLFVGKI